MSTIPPNYIAVLSEIKAAIKHAQYKAVKSVNTELILMYLNLGKTLLDQSRNGWGDSVIDKISLDLQVEFSGIKGFSTRNLRRMKMLAQELESQTEILPQLVAELPWGHLVLLFERVKEQKNRQFYIRKVIENGWSKASLEENIKFELHLKVPIQNNFVKTLSVDFQELGLDFQDVYNLSFLELERGHSEKQLETALVAQITGTLGQFGKDFAFMGRQFPLEVSDKEYFVDLLFYHRKLKSLIAIELKTVEFKTELQNIFSEIDIGPPE